MVNNSQIVLNPFLESSVQRRTVYSRLPIKVIEVEIQERHDVPKAIVIVVWLTTGSDVKLLAVELHELKA
jgi:hypothetical protein